MEFVEASTSSACVGVANSDRLPPAEGLFVVAQMLRGLDDAHRRTDPDNRPLGIVHLDVKPANVLVSFEGEVKLTDFGVARSRDARRPTEGISGTIPFMSPEQTRGEPLDLRSDVFSAGVVLYTLLAGECPFGEEDTGQTLYEIQSCRYRPPAGLERPELFEPLLRRALTARPEDRFPSAGAFADAIDELMFAQGWRGGAAALRDRLRAAFPDERARLNALFDPGRRREGLAVTHASPREGTMLSRVVAAAPVPDTPRRPTLVAADLPRPRGRAARALTTLGITATLAAAALFFLRPRPSPAHHPTTHRHPPARPNQHEHEHAHEHAHAHAHALEHEHAHAEAPPRAPPLPHPHGHHLHQRQPLGHRPRQRQARRHHANPPLPRTRRPRIRHNREPEARTQAGRRENRAEEGHAPDRRPARRW